MAEASDVKRRLPFRTIVRCQRRPGAESKACLMLQALRRKRTRVDNLLVESGLYRQCTCGVYVKNSRIPALLQCRFLLFLYPRPTTWRMLLRPFGYTARSGLHLLSTAPAYLGSGWWSYEQGTTPRQSSQPRRQ
jgi:hypothetical protein